MAKTAIGNDRRTVSNTESDSYYYSNSHADPDTHGYTQCHTNSDTHAKCNSESYLHPDTYADTESHGHGNTYTKTYADPKTSASATSSTDITALMHNRSIGTSADNGSSVTLAL